MILFDGRYAETIVKPPAEGVVVNHKLGMKLAEMAINIFDDRERPIRAEAEWLDPNNLYVRVGCWLARNVWQPAEYPAIIITISGQ